MAFLAAQQHADPLQATQRLQEHLAVAQRQVAAFDQADGQFARQQHVLEPQRVGMATAQQRDAGAVVGGERLQRVAGDLQILPQLLDALGLEQLRHDAGHDAAVFQGVGDALRLAGAIGQDPPGAVRSAQHVGGVERQIAVPAAAIDGAAGAQERRIAIDEVGRDQAFGQQRLRTVEIGQDQFHQLGALRQAGFDG